MRTEIIISLFYVIVIITNILYVDFLFDTMWDVFNEDNFIPTENFAKWEESKRVEGLAIIGITFGMAIILLHTPMIWAASKFGMLLVRKFIPKNKKDVN